MQTPFSQTFFHGTKGDLSHCDPGCCYERRIS